MTMGETTELDVCTDCVMLIANGGCDSVEPSWCPDNEGLLPYEYACDGSCESASDADAAAVDRIWEGYDVTLGSVDCEYCGSEAREVDDQVEDCESWFSMGSCDGCGSRLGGSRFHAVAWKVTA